MSRIPLVLAALTACSLAQAAGVVEVNFVEPEKFADFGRNPADIERHSQALTEHLKRLGARLPDARALKLDVLDVNLAGEIDPRRPQGDLRVLRGRADWPSMKLRYVLSEAGRTVASGEDSIADMNYFAAPRGVGMNQALAYDLRLLDRWFAERILAPASAQ